MTYEDCPPWDNSYVDIFTDGACLGNPGPGGWGVLLRWGQSEREISGSEAMTTNNRMELTAAVRALEILKRPCRVQLYTDSRYLRDGIDSWIIRWKQRNWRDTKGRPIKNIDLWKQLDSVQAQHQIAWLWVKGHANHADNERVDHLARQAAQKMVNS